MNMMKSFWAVAVGCMLSVAPAVAEGTKHSMEEEGFWTAERWNVLSAEFKGDDWSKCKEFLKFVVEGKYKFPVKAFVGM